jgi:hypothetical protein
LPPWQQRPSKRNMHESMGTAHNGRPERELGSIDGLAWLNWQRRDFGLRDKLHFRSNPVKKLSLERNFFQFAGRPNLKEVRM